MLSDENPTRLRWGFFDTVHMEFDWKRRGFQIIRINLSEKKHFLFRQPIYNRRFSLIIRKGCLFISPLDIKYNAAV